MSDEYFLSKGHHFHAAEGRCAMEWVAYIAGEPHTDKPVCVSPVLRGVAIGLNDIMPNDVRQKLRPYLGRMIGTAGDGFDEERLGMLHRWGVFPEQHLIGVALQMERAVKRRLLDLVALVGSFAMEEAFCLLENLLPTEAVDLPAEVSVRAAEVVGGALLERIVEHA